MAREDRSRSCAYLASALQRLDPPVRWSVAGELLTHAEDAADENLPKIIWFGIEPLVAANPAIALDRAGNGRIRWSHSSSRAERWTRTRSSRSLLQ